LSFEDIADSQPISLPDAIAWIITKNIDVVVPQMFCIPGMTHYRALCDVLKIRYIGNTPEVMAITANKAKAKAIVAAAGVKVHKRNLKMRSQESGVRRKNKKEVKKKEKP
jgi:D-alanine-D-alanine ligase